MYFSPLISTFINPCTFTPQRTCHALANAPTHAIDAIPNSSKEKENQLPLGTTSRSLIIDHTSM